MHPQQHGEGPPPSQPGPERGTPAEATSARELGTALRGAEWLALAAAVVVAHLFYWRVVNHPSAHDAQSYLDIAADIGRKGLFDKHLFAEVRTYGYPLLLSVFVRAASALGLPVGWLVFEAQLAIYLLAAAFFRRGVAGLWPSFAPWAFVSIVLNVFALSYTPESLTESVTLSLILIGAGCWLALLAQRGPAWKPVLLGSLAMGAAVMVRPASMFALAAWVLAVAAACLARRPRARTWPSVAVALVAGCALPMLPQYVNNVRNFGRHTPLIVASLARGQQLWGLNLKYATAMPPVPTPSIWYLNPFTADTTIDPEDPLSWYVEHPRIGATTLALHVFNLLDQDLLFTYSRDLDPWYRVPVGIPNHALIALALIGAGLLAARARREPRLRLVATALAAYTLSHVALHAPILVEMRFGLPLLLAAGPAAGAAVRALSTRRSWLPRVLAGAWVVLWVTGALALSHWVRQQAPAIRAWETAHARAAPGGR